MNEQNTLDKLWSGEFVLTCCANLSLFMGFHMLTATFPFYVTALGGDEALAGFAAGVFSISSVLMRPLAGWVLDNQGRRAIMLLGLAGMALLPLLYWACSLLALIVALRLLHGMTWACASTALNTAACDIIPHRRFAEGMGYFGLTSAISTAIAPAVGLAIMAGSGFGPLFWLTAALMGLTLLLAIGLKLPPLPPQRPRHSLLHSLKNLLNRESLPAALTMLCFLLPYGGVTTFVAMYASTISLANGGIYFTCLAITTALMRVLTGRLADRYGEGPMVYASVGCQTIALLLLAISPTMLTFIISALLFGMGFGMMTPAMQAMAMRIATPERRGAASSTFLCGFDIGIGLGGIISGQLVKYCGYANMYALMIGGLLAALAIYLRWGRRSASAFHPLP